MADNADYTAPVDVEIEETSGRQEPALDLSGQAGKSAGQEAVLDAEFDDVSRQVEPEFEQEPSAKVNTPLQDRPVPRISIEAFCKSPDNGSVMQQVARSEGVV